MGAIRCIAWHDQQPTRRALSRFASGSGVTWTRQKGIQVHHDNRDRGSPRHEGSAGVTGTIGNDAAATISIGAGLEGRITAQSGAKVSAREPSVELGGKALDYLPRN